MRRLIALVAASVLAGPWLALPACGLDKAGAGTGSADGGSDSSVVETGIDTGVDTDLPAPDSGGSDAACAANQVVCGGQCVSGCAGCASGQALCPETRVCGHCADCNGRSAECFACTGGGSPQAFCAATCGAISRCACPNGDAKTCPGPTQVCQNDQCFACGEPSTDQNTCANGKTCAATATPPACN